MAKRRSATQRNIDSINRNLRNIAAAFGTQSQQYEAATMDLFRFKVRTNKDGVLQLQGAAANKKYHQAIRARRNDNLNIKKAKAASVARMENYNTNKLSKQRFTSIKAFEMMQKAYEDLQEKVYTARDMAQEYDIDYDAYSAFKDPMYLASKYAEIEEARLQQEYEAQAVSRETIVNYNAAGVAQVLDKETGEILYQYESGDFFD